MIDLGIAKIAVIGVVAIVVIGPERLPVVARKFGLLVSRMQRYMRELQAQVSREIKLDAELPSMLSKPTTLPQITTSLTSTKKTRPYPI